MKAADKTLNDLFTEILKDTYSAEKQVLRALGKMSKAAESEKLAVALDAHRAETEGQIDRLQQIFEMLGKPARGKTCEAINGILEEANEIAQEFKGSEVLDAGIIAAQQAVEHYEITRYGTLKSWAAELGLEEAVPLLAQTLEEERKTDEILTKLAEERVNQDAAEAGAEGE
ncbi:ferritin-like domain-containing protein [Bradyrhizobium sp. STM 3557]|uniref:YciE/YciF ferroxidase family protein n=1 Tax=Bradyrhizobium sp. STM 3557 TaxID=578920 RepID=UPI00388FCD91